MIAPSTVRDERLKPRIRSVGIVVAAAAVAALFASPALAATSWGTVSSSYNGITRSTAFGTFYDDRATYATVLAHLNDTANDGDNVYVNADEYFWETDPWTCKSLPCWLFDRTKTSAEDSWFNTPVNLYLTKDGWLESGGEQKKMTHQLCLILSRPCVVGHKANAIVAAIEKMADNVPRDVKAFEDIIDFLTSLQRGADSPDVFYLGQIQGFEGRFAARLDSLHTIQIPLAPIPFNEA